MIPKNGPRRNTETVSQSAEGKFARSESHGEEEEEERASRKQSPREKEERRRRRRKKFVLCQ